VSLADEYLEKKSSFRWWDKEARDNINGNIWNTVDHLIREQYHHEVNYMHQLRMYSSRHASVFYGQDFSAMIDPGQIIRMNAIKSCVDTATAQIAAERSRCMHLVSGGDAELARKATKMDKYVLGVLLEANHYPISLDSFRDGNVWGSGEEKWYTRGNKIICERVPTTEIIFDDNECRYGSPRNIYQVKDVDADEFAYRFKKNKEEIRGSSLLREEMYNFDQGLHRPITAIEAWHLPSGPGAKDGLHAIITSDAICLVEPWEHDCFPFTKWDWQTAPFGYNGMGLTEELTPIQIEINFIAQKVQRIFNLAGGIVWTEKGSQVGRMNNRDLVQKHYKGRPPVFQQMGSVPAEMFNHMDRLYSRCFEQSGVSQMAAQGTRPPGIESGEGLRVLYDIGSRRFRHTSQRWADYHVNASKQVVRCSEEILARGGKVEIVGPGEKYIENLNYADIRLPENSYLVKRFPVSLLPDEPAGKLETVSKIMQMVGPDMAPQFIGLLTGMPDVERIVKRFTAPLDAAESIVQRILATGEYEPPRPNMNLQLLLDMAVKEMNFGYVEGVPEERLSVLQRFIDDIGFLQERMMPPPMPGGLPPEGMGETLPGQPPSPEAMATPPAVPPVGPPPTGAPPVQ
jgi:hypothetical protein